MAVIVSTKVFHARNGGFKVQYRGKYQEKKQEN
jgi:hypothetical protein